jgi:16S rRNA (cytidine1402-2'-O)-methyltransferase
MQSDYELKAGIYLVPTPIGNLDDITVRALKVLSNADVIACEDTRHSGSMLKHYKIVPKKLVSYHEHNEEKQTEQLIELAKDGKSIALISDAGSPGISDPGYKLVQKAIANDIYTTSLPGATAFVPALTLSGMEVSEFTFFGFPPQKKGRKTFLEKVAGSDSVAILYESPYKIPKLIDELIGQCGEEREIALVREISKIHEEVIRGSLGEVKKVFEKKQAKGEFVVILKNINESD